MIFKKKYRLGCIILCGGLGVRIGKLGRYNNKTMLKINNKPILYYILKLLNKFDINDIYLPLGYKGDQIKKYLNERNIFKKLFFSFAQTGLNTSIENRLKKITNLIHKDINYLLILNGDSIYNLNIDMMLKKIIKSNKKIILYCSSLDFNYGNIKYTNKIKKFNKNLKFNSFKLGSDNYFFYSGLCLIEKDFFIKNISKANKDFEDFMFNKAISKNQLQIYTDSKSFFQVNTIKDYLFLQNNIKL